jgi:hypothetical protein
MVLTISTNRCSIAADKRIHNYSGPSPGYTGYRPRMVLTISTNRCSIAAGKRIHNYSGPSPGYTGYRP